MECNSKSIKMVDTTNLTNITGLQGIAYYTNSMTDGLLITGGIIVLSIVMMIVLSKNQEPFVNVLTSTGWLFFLISMFFWAAQLLPIEVGLGYLFIAGFGTLALYYQQ